MSDDKSLDRDDSLNTLVQLCGHDSVTVDVFVRLLKFCEDMNRRNIERNMRLDTLEARIAQLEARPAGLKYVGTWASGRPYNEGDVVTDAGSMWVARETTMGRPGVDHPAWQLSVKRGKDGKDARP